MRRHARALCLLALMTVCIGCDRVTKDAAVQNLQHAAPVDLVGGIVHLEYAENRGAFLNLGDSLPAGARFAVLVIGTSLLLACIAFVLVRRPRAGWSVPLCLILAGGAGNLVDRAMHGRVVDFLQIGIGPVRTGIFNMADVAITSGVLVLCLAGLREPKAASRQPG
jgi:signal peptidase II